MSKYIIYEEAINGPKQPIVYSCPQCGRKHNSEEAAITCRDQVLPKPTISAGDIVVCPAKWRSRKDESVDPMWIAYTVPPCKSHKSHFRHVPQMVPYFVVADLFVVDHEVRTTILTRAWPLESDADGWSGGWTHADLKNEYRHCAVRRIGHKWSGHFGSEVSSDPNQQVGHSQYLNVLNPNVIPDAVKEWAGKAVGLHRNNLI